ncbi:acyl carrier protein [Sphaerisporangium rhizosphaerae]|uniref:Acyl carrier protein n=1 Tax=Sphaerisporangium rhizosphaerae TaxID=2269375 RepID=A0ABW2PGQ5_9ACTN
MPEREQIIKTVTAHLSGILPGMSVENPDIDKDLRDFAEYDSLSILEVLVWLESEFSLSIPDEELIVDNFSSVGKMVDYVIAHR